jgi:hypothetical protein
MVVFGGQDGVVTGNFCGDTANHAACSDAEYDPVSNAWTALSTTNEPDFRRQQSGIWDDADKVAIFWGGIGPDLGNGSYRDTGGRFTP